MRKQAKMTNEIRVVLPDNGRNVLVRFRPTERSVDIEWDEDHYLDVMFDRDGQLVASSGYPHEEAIGHDPVGEISRLVSIGRPLAELIVEQFLEMTRPK
jgi:hypothetical protein